MDKQTKIGRIGKAHGLKGEVKCEIESVYLADFANAEVLFLEHKGRMLPYFVERIRMSKPPILALEDVTSKEQAQILRNTPIFMRNEAIQLADFEEDQSPYAKYKGFSIIDETLGEIGKIDDILVLPQHEVALVSYKEKEVLIPMNEAYILETKEAEQQLVVSLPEGLLDLF